jgi:hypothetical protein
MGCTVLQGIHVCFYESEAVLTKYTILYKHFFFIEYPVCSFLNTVQSIGMCNVQFSHDEFGNSPWLIYSGIGDGA